MAGVSKESEEEYVLKKGQNDIPVEACKGWFDPCEYCDKRFCAWAPIDDDIYEKIPEKPGFVMIALKNKNSTEVVSIIYDQTNIQTTAITYVDKIKALISDKKSKASKSAVLIRWMVIKKISDKENSILCAHWSNNGVLPKFSKDWPGQTLMEDSEAIVFSNQIQKWCYPPKNPTWRKPKPPPSKNLEEVKKCNFQSCEICDSYFTPWKALSDVNVHDLTHDKGQILISVVYGKQRDIVQIQHEYKCITVEIKPTIEKVKRFERDYLRPYVNKNPRVEVRWMMMKDADSDNSCFLFAHWLNADKYPSQNFDLDFLQAPLNKNKHFIFRNNDKKWFYETEALKPSKFSKAKDRRQLLDELRDDIFDQLS